LIGDDGVGIDGAISVITRSVLRRVERDDEMSKMRIRQDDSANVFRRDVLKGDDETKMITFPQEENVGNKFVC
jgi:hypothetical protein